jgi:hypothetical protein
MRTYWAVLALTGALAVAAVPAEAAQGLGVNSKQEQTKLSLADSKISWTSGTIDNVPSLAGVGFGGAAHYTLRGPLNDLTGVEVQVEFPSSKAATMAAPSGKILGADLATLAGENAVTWLYGAITSAQKGTSATSKNFGNLHVSFEVEVGPTYEFALAVVPVS